MKITESRRDDLESLGYILIYLMKGTLPWAKTLQKKKQTKIDFIPWELPKDDNSWITTLQMKRQIPVEDMCEGCPIEFIMFLNYSKGKGIYNMLAQVTHPDSYL